MAYFVLLVQTLLLIALYKIVRAVYGIVVLKIRTSAIPGPKGVPILGSAVELITMKLEDLTDWFINNSRQFKNGLFKVWLGPDVMIILTAPYQVEKIVSSSIHIEKTNFYDPMRPWLGRGLITSGGQKWSHDRKLISPTFHFSILEKYVPIMNDKSRIMVKCIEKKIGESSGGPIELDDIIIRCTLDILCLAAMGIDIHAQEQDTEYTRALHKFSQLVYHRMFRPWFKYKWIYYLNSSGRDYYAQLKKIHQFSRDVIRKRIEWRRAHEDELQNDGMADDIGNKRKKALLDHLLDVSEKSVVPMTEEEIREQIDTFMFAGHDTTGYALVWFFFCLGNSPEHQRKVHEELDAIFGDSDRPLTLKDLAELKYMDRVIKESLRMYAPVPIIGRYLTQDVDIGEYVIPKGADVGICPFLTHRRPDVWPDPEKFDPDRFLPENIKNRNPYAYIPFSAGPRNCVGQKFAQIEEKIIAVHILRKWEVKSILRHDQIKTLWPVVLKPVNGIKLDFIARK